jgi:glyceraldehyde 3-phosphate dehydrogenase
MRTRVGINGMGRIGRAVLRGLVQRPDSPVEVVAVNDIAPTETLAHLLRYDSTYGPWSVPVQADDRHLQVGEHLLRVFDHARLEDMEWHLADVDVVIEATGRFTHRAGVHIAHGGVRKVVVTAPGSGVDATIVMGVNDEDYLADSHHVVSAASCTTNCAAPMANVLDRAFGVRHGLLTTVHSYTGDQNLLDAPHRDLRRARAAATNMIPTSTGAARAIGEVLPGLAGRIDGMSIRVPVADVSLVDLTVQLAETATAGQVNRAFHTAADGPLKGVLRCTSDPVVSGDLRGDPASCVLDTALTVVNGELVKVFGWYDNEWGYGQRVVDLVELIARTLPER